MSGCTWRLKDTGLFETGCGELFGIDNHDTLTDNGMAFCCYCGGKILEAKAASQATSKPKAYPVGYLGRGRLND